MKNGFDYHAFIAEDAKDSGVFAKIEIAKFKALTGDTRRAKPDIDFYACASRETAIWNADLRFRGGGERGLPHGP